MSNSFKNPSQPKHGIDTIISLIADLVSIISGLIEIGKFYGWWRN